MRIVAAHLLKSAPRKEDWPLTDEPEISFCGRSNVGKSSLLNALLGRKGLARVSQTPGRTRLLHFFRVEAWLDTVQEQRTPALSTWVDLPGFGYAHLSQKERMGWRTMVETYFTQRHPLRVVLLLVDSRRIMDLAKNPEALQEEEALLRYLQNLEKRVGVVITKADKLPKNQQKVMAHQLRQAWGVKPLLYSSLTRLGQEELHLWIERTLFSTSPVSATTP